jgi:hypothetical protein
MFNRLEVLALIENGTIEKSSYRKDNRYNPFFIEMKDEGLIDFMSYPHLTDPDPRFYNFSLTEYGKKVLEDSKS